MLDQVEVYAIGDRIRRAASLIDLVRGLDLESIQNIITLGQAIANANNLKEAINYSIDLLKVVSKVTSTKVDDKVVAFIDMYVDENMINLIVSIVESVTGNSFKALAVTNHEMALNKYQAMGIDTSLIVQLALQLLPLLAEFLRKRKAEQ